MTTTMTRQSDVIDWLNDAYAMERSLEVMLRKQAANEDAPAPRRSFPSWRKTSRDQAMASWLDQNVNAVVRDYLLQPSRPQPATV